MRQATHARIGSATVHSITGQGSPEGKGNALAWLEAMQIGQFGVKNIAPNVGLRGTGGNPTGTQGITEGGEDRQPWVPSTPRKHRAATREKQKFSSEGRNDLIS